MKRLLVLVLALALLSPALAFAGASTDAALGLGAFAVFNQIISGTGVFGGFHGYPAPAPVFVGPPPPVFVAPPPPVVVAPPPRVVVVPPRVTYYSSAPAYYHRAPSRAFVERGWCPPGHMRHGRCF